MTQAVEALRDEVARLHLEAEAQQLRAQIRYHEEAATMLEDWGDFVDPLDSLRSEQDYGLQDYSVRADRPDDRREGDNAPHFRNETELARIRGVCDYLGRTDSTVIGALDTLAAYVHKDGFTHTATAEQPEGEQIATEIQAVLDEFTKRVGWYGGVDKESFKRTRRQGERFLRVTDLGGGYSGVEFYEPSWITEPTNREQFASHYGMPLGLSWKYGVVTETFDVTQVWGYFAAKFGEPGCAEFIPAEQMSHVKVNVDRNVKRGLSDLYPGRKWITKADKLLERVVDGGAIQASIALFREWPSGTKNSLIQSAADSQVEFHSVQPAIGGGTTSVPVEQYRSGQVVDGKGFIPRPGPLGQSNAPTFLEIHQAVLRTLSRLWGFTEDIISGDASNQNYASLLEASSPFLMRVLGVQADVACDDVEVLWKVVDRAVDAGRLPYDKKYLREVVAIKATPPDIQSRDRKQEHDIRAGEHQAGLLSLSTWAEETGRDFDEEQQKRSAEPEPKPQFGQLFAAPGMPDPRLAYEAQHEALATRALEAYLENNAIPPDSPSENGS